MKINKQEALLLAKIISQFVGFHDGVKTKRQQDLETFLDRLDCFLTNEDDCDSREVVDDSDCADEADEEEENEEDEDNCVEEEEPAEKEDEEEGEEDDDEESDDGDDEQDIVSDLYVTQEALHGLKAARSYNTAVEFEHCTDSETLKLLEDGLQVASVAYLRRKGKELHVGKSDGEWIVYYVDRYPTGWVDVLPLNKLAEVV